MKEQMTYVAIDADNVGDSIGDAVLSNDTSLISQLSESINSGVQIFSKWAEYNGGSVISSGSDEAIFQVPITSIEELEKLKEEYSAKTGFTISIGIGEVVSNAMKALIYAKMNGKNQIMDYSPEMEQTMQQSLNGGHQEEIETEEIPEHEKHLSEEGKEIHDATEIETDEEEVNEEEMAAVGEEAVEEEPQVDQEAPLEEEAISADMSDEFAQESLGEEDLLEEEIPAEEAFSDEAPVLEEEEVAPEEEIIEEDEAMTGMAESDNVADEDIDLDGQPDIQEDHGEIGMQDDIDSDGDVEHEEAMAGAVGAEEEYNDEGDLTDEYPEEGEEELADSIASEMGEEEIPEEEMEGEYPEEEYEDEIPEEGMEEEALGEEGHQQVKDTIFNSLQSFKQNREYLESIAQENPELHDSLIMALQAMIEMAREMGYGNIDEEVADDGDMLSEEDDVMSMGDEEILDAGEAIEGEMEEEMNPDDYAVDEGEEEIPEEEIPEEEMEGEFPEDEFEKSENFVSLLRKMNATMGRIKLMKSDADDMKEIKERIKKKISESKNKGKSVAGGKKKKSKKPGEAANEKAKSKGKKQSTDGSFCAKSHQKMRSSGKDCRANSDKNSPVCSARKKFNCRGKNEEKGGIHKSEEKLASFLKKKDEKELEKSKLATKRTTKHVTKPHNPEGTQKGYKVKDIDNETGKAQWLDGSRGLATDDAGDPIAPEGNSPRSIRKPKMSPAVKV